MDRGVSMPNMLEPKASIFFFLYWWQQHCNIHSQRVLLKIHILSFFFFFNLTCNLINTDEKTYFKSVLPNKEVGPGSVDQTKQQRNCFTHTHRLVGTTVEKKNFGSQRCFYSSGRGEHIHLSRLSDSSMLLQELPSHSQRFSMPASPCSSAYSFNFQVAGYCMWHTVENPMPRLSSKQLISLYTVQYISDCSDDVHMSWSEATENFKFFFFSWAFQRNRRPQLIFSRTGGLSSSENENSKIFPGRSLPCGFTRPILQVFLVCTKLLHRYKSVLMSCP